MTARPGPFLHAGRRRHGRQGTLIRARARAGLCPAIAFALGWRQSSNAKKERRSGHRPWRSADRGGTRHDDQGDDLGSGRGAAALLAAGAARAAEPDSCKKVRFSDVGWTDITSTTAATTEVLKGLGYQTDIEILSVPVTYASLKNKDIDVFLGNWMPTHGGRHQALPRGQDGRERRRQPRGRQIHAGGPDLSGRPGAQGLRRHQ